MIGIHYKKMLDWKPEPIAVREMRKHIGWYLRGIWGAGQVRAEINRAEKPDQVYDILSRLQEEISAKRNREVAI